MTLLVILAVLILGSVGAAAVFLALGDRLESALQRSAIRRGALGNVTPIRRRR